MVIGCRGSGWGIGVEIVIGSQFRGSGWDIGVEIVIGPQFVSINSIIFGGLFEGCIHSYSRGLVRKGRSDAPCAFEYGLGADIRSRIGIVVEECCHRGDSYFHGLNFLDRLIGC